MSKKVVEHSSAFYNFLLAITQWQRSFSAGQQLLSFRFLNDFWLGVNVQSGIMVNGIGKLLQHLHQMDIKILTRPDGNESNSCLKATPLKGCGSSLTDHVNT